MIPKEEAQRPKEEVGESRKALKECGENKENGFSGSVTSYENAEGVKVFKIVNLVEIAKKEPDELVDLVQVTSLNRGQKKAVRKDSGASDNVEAQTDGAYQHCLVCNAVLSENCFSIFCSQCLIIESLD
ncbi:hypothetical protein NEHOM01_0859 [Nematocida homosporus]|uniref:uncharacterized protein n=1 Tax=Nematocida homosporus TaxID=1912981 RepID=UPI00221F1351|nr:uncharacterized protein NEHOM01_0859 [Nematocida homosporus]KAI5185500.1 hypothetical protein NEHOM01_0859 [Nematocida homosporus]